MAAQIKEISFSCAHSLYVNRPLCVKTPSVISEKAKKLFVSIAEAVTVPFSIISIPTQYVF